MREVTSDYLEQVESSGRQFGFYVKVYGNSEEGDTLWLGDIISIDILRSISDKLQLGACLSDKLTLQTRATNLFGGKGKKIEVFYRCTAPITGWSKLGTFYVDSSVTKDGVTAVTAYDMMNRLGKKMSWVDTSKATAPTFPCKMQQMLKYICDRFGFTTDFACGDITVEKAPDGYTAREIISYIAASHGANARFSPSEVLKFVGYTKVNRTIEYKRCFSFDSGEKFTVNGLLFSKDDSTKIYIDDKARVYDEDADGIVEVFNPFATVAISEYAWGKLGNLSYNAVSLEMPAENILEPGDVFTVREADGTEKTAIVMDQQFSVSSSEGFVEKISCGAESKNQTRNSENRAEATEKKINSSSTAERLQGANSEYYATTSDYGFAIYKKGDAYDELVCHIQADPDGSTGLKIGNTSGYGIEFLKDYAGFQITSRNNFLRLDENSAEFLSVYTSTGHDFRVAYQNGGIAIKCDRNVLQFGADGLYYNGTKIG